MTRINERSVRERAIIFLGLIAILFSVWDSTVNTPLVNKQKAMISELNNKNAERLVLNTRLQELIVKSKADPDAENRARLQSLKEKLVSLETELEVSTRNLVKPEQMPRLLENVLNQTEGLTLHNLKSLGVSSLIEQPGDTDNPAPATQQPGATTIASAYKHGLRIEFGGDYFSTMEYLEKLEQLEWGFFWDNFTLNVENYPDTRAAIEIFTLSLSREWIGV
ncbi:MAG: hypothetical protein RLT87_06970 [Gammaproteobacteria bacterium]